MTFLFVGVRSVFSGCLAFCVSHIVMFFIRRIVSVPAEHHPQMSGNHCADYGAAVKKDIEEGAKIGINSTPTYVINGSPVGGLTPALFEDFIAVLKDAR